MAMLRQLTKVPRILDETHRLARSESLISWKQFPLRDVTGKSIQGDTAMENEFLFEHSSKRRKGFPSETKVKRGFPSGSLR